MTTTTAELLSYEDPVELTERVAVAGFLAGYTGNTRTGHTTLAWSRSVVRALSGCRGGSCRQTVDGRRLEWTDWPCGRGPGSNWY